MSTLNVMLQNLIDRGTKFIPGLAGDELQNRPIQDLVSSLLQSRGESSGMVLAALVLDRFEELDDQGKLDFFQILATDYDPVVAQIEENFIAYQDSGGSPESLEALLSATEPERQELFRLLNLAPGGTESLVRMRAHLLKHKRHHVELAKVDNDLKHLLRSWFNRGFLVLRPIDWSTPADILEKIIDYEAVHQIDSWDELRRRLEPEDRKCFAFFHPAMHNEPLVFVEVALTKDRPSSIQDVLREDRDIIREAVAQTAVFYSISNCQKGLREISFGAFLIKQVVSELSRMLPQLSQFVTLSPVPGFVAWLNETNDPALDLLSNLDKSEDREANTVLMDAAARYFIEAKRPDGYPYDPVARFHLRNGAQLAAINWMGDTSTKGLKQAAGIMVNYLYDLNAIETNHENYVHHKKVAVSRQVRSHLARQSKSKGASSDAQ